MVEFPSHFSTKNYKIFKMVWNHPMDMSRLCNVECVYFYNFGIHSQQRRYHNLSDIYIPWDSIPSMVGLIEFILSNVVDRKI